MDAPKLVIENSPWTKVFTQENYAQLPLKNIVAVAAFVSHFDDAATMAEGIRFYIRNENGASILSFETKDFDAKRFSLPAFDQAKIISGERALRLAQECISTDNATQPCLAKSWGSHTVLTGGALQESFRARLPEVNFILPGKDEVYLQLFDRPAGFMKRSKAFVGTAAENLGPYFFQTRTALGHEALINGKNLLQADAVSGLEKMGYMLRPFAPNKNKDELPGLVRLKFNNRRTLVVVNPFSGKKKTYKDDLVLLKGHIARLEPIHPSSLSKPEP